MFEGDGGETIAATIEQKNGRKGSTIIGPYSRRLRIVPGGGREGYSLAEVRESFVPHPRIMHIIRAGCNHTIGWPREPWLSRTSALCSRVDSIPRGEITADACLRNGVSILKPDPEFSRYRPIIRNKARQEFNPRFY